MSDLTRRFDLSDMKEWETREILTEVYNSLQQKGYNPINQIVGYIPPLFSSQWNPFEEVSLTRRQQCVTIRLQLTGKEVYRIG